MDNAQLVGGVARYFKATVSLESGSVRVVTTIFAAAQNGRPFSAVISPDAQQIAFTRPVNGRDRDIFTIREDGTGEKIAVESTKRTIIRSATSPRLKH